MKNSTPPRGNILSEDLLFIIIFFLNFSQKKKKKKELRKRTNTLSTFAAQLQCLSSICGFQFDYYYFFFYLKEKEAQIK